MLDLKFIVTERDVDLLVLEELEVSESFRHWFSTRIFDALIYQEHIGAWHSVTSAGLGESDLIFMFQANDGSRKAVLIENKIDAPPQPQQGERYSLRGAKGQEEGIWDEFKTCIIAPKKYLESVKHSEIYDVQVSYEELLAYFSIGGQEDERASFRARFVLEGIEQNRRGYQPVVSKEVTAFTNAYIDFANETRPDLEVEKRRNRAAGSTWIYFKKHSAPQGVSFAHQLTAGYVKIWISGKADQLDDYFGKYEGKLAGLEVQKSGKSIVLALPVDKIDPAQESFEDAVPRIGSALSSLAQLLNCAIENSF